MYLLYKLVQVNYFCIKNFRHLVQNKKFLTTKNSWNYSGLPICAGISNGDTVALQTFVRNYWLSGYLTSWSRQSCPRMQMSGTDWTACWGEVFTIYRASGPGQVCVGDLIGIYYPRSPGYWMGCTGGTCPRSSCPGQPTTAHGFGSEENWYTCCSEVFKVYASGKANGDVISSGDDIMLYNLDLGRWVAQDVSTCTTTTTCAGITRPPPVAKFDECHKETFKIWKRP